MYLTLYCIKLHKHGKDVVLVDVIYYDFKTVKNVQFRATKSLVNLLVTYRSTNVIVETSIVKYRVCLALNRMRIILILIHMTSSISVASQIATHD